MASGKESLRERLEKWRIEKGRPPRPDKPWIPVRKRSEPCSVGTSNLTILETRTRESEEDVSTIKIPTVGSLKRSRTDMNSFQPRTCIAPKRRRTNVLQEVDKENFSNTHEVPTEHDQNTVNGNKLQDASRSSSKRDSLQKSRRELLVEWKKTKESKLNASKKMDVSYKSRRLTIAVCPPDKRDSAKSSHLDSNQEANSVCQSAVSQYAGSHRRQTIVMSRNHMTPIVKQMSEKSFVKPSKPGLILPLSSTMKTAPVSIRRQTMVIRRPSTPAVPQRKCADKLPTPGAKASAVVTSKVDPPVSQVKSSLQDPISNTQRTSISALHRVAKTKDKASVATVSVVNKLIPLPQNKSRQLFPLRKTPCHSKTKLSSLSNAAKTTNLVKKPTLPGKIKLQVVSKISKTVTMNKSNIINQNKILCQSKPAESQQLISTAVTKGSLPRSNLNLSQASALKTSIQSSDRKSTRKSCLGIRKTNENMKTPLAHKSVAFELPLRGSSRSSPSLRKRLSTWLMQQDKTPPSYRHLRCFGVELSEMKQDQKKQKPNLAGTPSNHTNFGSSPELCSVNTLLAGRIPLHAAVHCGNAPQLENSESNNEIALKKPVAETESEKLKKYHSILEDLEMLLNNSYSPQNASNWLDALYECTEAVRNLSLYWVCRARVSQLSGNIPEALNLVEMGISIGAQPSDKLSTLKLVLLEMTKPTYSSDVVTPKRKGLDLQNAFSSTVIRYIVNNKTPVHQKSCEISEVHPVIVTPVRRSSRISNCTMASQHLTTPLSNKFSNHCVASLDDIPEHFRSRMILVPNSHLKMLMESPPEFGSPSLLESENHFTK